MSSDDPAITDVKIVSYMLSELGLLHPKAVKQIPRLFFRHTASLNMQLEDKGNFSTFEFC